MKIGILIESMAVASGGPSRVAGVIASGLVERGHEVVLGTLPRGSELVKVDERVRWEYVGGAIRNPLNWFKAVGGIRRLSREVDILFVSGIWGPVDGLALRLANITNIPIHTRICGMLEAYILRRNPERKWVGRKFYTDRNLRHSTSLIVNTKIEKSHVQALGFETPIEVIPNGVVLPQVSERLGREEAIGRLGLNIKDGNKVLLYLSRIHPKKGLHYLLQALSGEDLRVRSDWDLVVAGDFFQGEDYEEQIRSLVRDAGLHNRVHFVGEVAGERKRAAWSLGEVFVLPSESEGFSNAVVEAMSWGMPVLITTGCNFPEVAEEQAGWVVDGKMAGLGDVIKTALDDEQLRKLMGENARKLVSKEYQQSHVIERYERLAQAVMPRKKLS